MTKPIDLTIYEKHPTADAYRVDGFYSPYALVSKDKRFTEAELAAEYWRANALGWMHEDACEFTRAEQHSAEANTLRRFATLPHHDGVTA